MHQYNIFFFKENELKISQATDEIANTLMRLEEHRRSLERRKIDKSSAVGKSSEIERGRKARIGVFESVLLGRRQSAS